jgi:hypothetical protein
LGIGCARVQLWQQDNRGDWFPVVGEAHWDEFAPIKDEWEEDPTTGAFRRSGRQVLENQGGWARMPRLMITKCATMQALRAGWPDQFGNIYAEEEMDQARALDQTASELVEKQREQNRLIAIAGKDAITVFWGDAALENVPIGEFADRVLAWMIDRQPEEISHWATANREPLRLFWAKAPSDALELKRIIEARSSCSHETQSVVSMSKS